MGAIRAVDAGTGEEIWRYSIGGFVVGAPAVDGDGVYASSGRRLVRLDRATGEERWSVDTHDHPQAQINASPGGGRRCGDPRRRQLRERREQGGLHLPWNHRRVRHRLRRGGVAVLHDGRRRDRRPRSRHLVDSGHRSRSWRALRRDGSEPRRAHGPAHRLDPRDRLHDRPAASGRGSSPTRTCSARPTPPGRTPTSAPRRTSGAPTGGTWWEPATRAAPSTPSIARPVRWCGRRS